jgi:hypothetical protein
MIIALIGAERVGKDTVADILVSEYGFKKHSMADPIREISNIIFPQWFNDDDKLEFAVDKDSVDPKSGICPRDFMKWLGTDIFQLEFHRRFPVAKIPQRSIWSSICANKITGIADSQVSGMSESANWVIPDVRFKHEAEQLAQLGCHFINLVPSTDLSDTGFTGQSTYDIPYILQNYNCYKIVNDKSAADGLAKLRQNTAELISQIRQ